VFADTLVSIIIGTHNSEDGIIECVNSVLSQEYRRFEIIIVDTASTDDTVDKVEQNFGTHVAVRLIKNPRYDWHTGGNNLGFQHSKGEMIVILNPDLTVDKFWLSALVEAYRKHANAGIVGSNILLFDNRDKINACGNDFHITGFIFARFCGERQCQCLGDEVVAAPSSASFIFSRDKLKGGRCHLIVRDF
jgi:GT2 family glycosyltransferase